MIFLILGPSGVGKGTQIKLLAERHPQFVFPRSVTTRKMRPGESHGNPYYFITQTEFDKHIEDQNFLEWAEVHKTARYGTLKKPIIDALDQNKTVIKELDIQGLINIHSTIEQQQLTRIKQQLRSIFILPPDEETLIQRITQRAPIKEIELNARLESARKEIQQSGICDYRLETSAADSIEAVYAKLEALIAQG